MDKLHSSKYTAGEKTTRKCTTIDKNIWKEACWYFDSNPVIAVWLMKDMHRNHTLNMHYEKPSMQAAYCKSGCQFFYVLQRDIDSHYSKNQLILLKFQNVSMHLTHFQCRITSADSKFVFLPSSLVWKVDLRSCLFSYVSILNILNSVKVT